MKQALFGCILAIFMGLGIVSGAMASTVVEDIQTKAGEAATSVVKTAEEVTKQAQAKATEVVNQVDQSAQAKEISAGLLQWIYVLAQVLSFSLFHWLAFALMVAGVVSWTGQLVIGKLVVASQGGFDLKEIISDATVLAISLIGLVLTTQAAAQNSTFTQSPVMVLSSAGIGVIFGIFLYFQGQQQELEAAKARGK